MISSASASASSTSTSSFQDKSLPRKRQSADQQLTDVSNQLPAKRHCSSRAVVSITQELKRKSPRGDSSAQLRPGSGTDKINFIHCQHFM